MPNPQRTPQSRNILAFLIVPLGFLAFLGLVIFLIYFNDELDRRLLADATDQSRQQVRQSSLGETESQKPSEEEGKLAPSATKLHREQTTSAEDPVGAEDLVGPENPLAKDKIYWRELEDLYKEIQDRRRYPEDYQAPISRLLVFLDEQYVVAYGPDDQGKEVVLRTFPCSSGIVPGHTPLGQHTLGAKWPDPWLFDNSRAQYGCQISGNILFHSLPSYDGSLKSGLKLSDLNSMGFAASHGCVRLFCMDAKWLYENAPVGCPVSVLQNRGEDYKDLPDHVFYLRLKDGAPQWDPTDPDPENPYHDEKVLRKWAVEKPWLQDYEVVEPVWPDLSAVPALPVPGASEGPSRAEIEPAYTGPTSPPPLDPHKAPEENAVVTSPPPLPSTLAPEPEAGMQETSPPPLAP